MRVFRADLHTHTVLSPCGSLEMSPINIINRAKEQGLDILGITDHNTTLHCPLVSRLGADRGIYVLMGVEVTTREDVHCLAFFEDMESLAEFQVYINTYLPYIKNKPSLFGYQVVVDEQENILGELEGYLGVGINQSIDDIRIMVKTLGGLFIPAHIDRPRYGVLSQLGLMPEGLDPDAIEIFGVNSKEYFLSKHPEFSNHTLVKNSDSHNLDHIGKCITEFLIEEPTFGEIRMALHSKNGRRVDIV